MSMAEKPTKPGAPWGDLRLRVISALVLIVLGSVAIWAGHGAFTLLLLVAGAAGFWELVHMAGVKRAARGLGGGDRRALALYGALAALGIWGLWSVSASWGRGPLVLLIALVAITDTLGYFTGRALGGPKFWPAISPKKTWSGIVGGWAGAAVLAALCHGLLDQARAPALIWFLAVAVALSLASQLGDIAQSAVKRRMGVKDASNLIPGHGGVLDRFDGLLAVGALAGIMSLFSG